MSDAGAGVGASPRIVDSDMSATADFSEFFDYNTDTIPGGSPFPNSFDIPADQGSKSLDPDVLPNPKQVVSTLGGGNIRAAESPDSLNDSFRDSSSDSDTSKRTGSSASGKTALTAGDMMMTDEPELKKPWNPSFTHANAAAEAPSMFEHTSPAMDDAYPLATDDQWFDFERASHSPEAATNGLKNIESPIMPTFQANGPQNGQSHNSRNNIGNEISSQHPLTQTMNKLHMSGSREVSPLSQGVPSQHASPSAVFNQSTPPTTNAVDFTNPATFGAAGGPLWPQKMDGLPNGMPNFSIAPQIHQQWMQQMMFSHPGFSPWPIRCTLIIHDTPAKSRVETQIPIKMTLIGAPPGVKKLHLPTYTISKPKLLAKPPVERSPEMLELYTQLVCTSAMQSEESKQKVLKRAAAASHPPVMPERSASEGKDGDEESKPQNGGEVRICTGCITRERKRAGRKKVKKVEEEETWKKDESRRVVVFNTHEIKDWQTSSGSVPEGQSEPAIPAGALQVDAPMRIACYCRHHGEKMGFQVVFTIKDWQDNVVAQEISHSIMITDDHKTHPVPQPLNAPALHSGDGAMMPLTSGPVETSPLASGAPFRLSQSSSDLQSLQHHAAAPSSAPASNAPTAPSKAQTPPSAPSAPTLSRPVSPSSNMGPASKKRKASGPRVPMEMTMTPAVARLDTTPPPGTQPFGQTMSNTSPYAAGVNGMQSPPDSMFGHAGGMPNVQQSFATGSTTPNNQDQAMFNNANRSSSMDNLAMPMFSAPPSTHPSRAPSPNGLRQSLGAMSQNPMAQGLMNGMSMYPSAPNQPRPQPAIHKIIPGEGPKMGGIEVTILGSGFTQGLDVFFGEHKATTTTFWGESSLVCLLPPAPRPGTVPVSLKQSHAQHQPFTPNPSQLFRYTDDEEAQLTKMMLGMISHKMTGQLLDVRELAQRIMGPQDSDWANMGGGSASGSGFGGTNYSMSVEPQLLKCLELIDLDDSARMPRLDLRRPTGQAMLHFGCSLGYHRFVAGLLARGANPDLRDKGGFTPMHMAALNDHEAIVRRLMQAGADPTIRSLSGFRPADVARSRKVIEHIRRCERHVRSRSRGSMHSRASSATSLKSLWDPRGPTEDSDVAVDEEESLEYSSGDFEDEDDVEDSWLDMRRSSSHVSGFGPERRASMPPGHDELEDEPGSPRTALAAVVRDQVSAQLHQFQQALQLHLPNLGHMPNLPQMPNLPRMPVLPDYHSYLQQSPFMGRMTSLMPNMTGGRPGSADGEAPKTADSKWWDLSSLLNNAPPPSYSELFPRGAFDKKQASAAQAAAEAEADSKCTALYDTPSAEVEAEADADLDTETVEATTSAAPVPRALRIGRKTAITKEQQQDFLRAHAEKFKGVRSDKNLFFIWIPLLTCIVAAMLYNRFPEFFSMAWAFVRSFVPVEQVPETARRIQDRVVEVV